MIIKVKHTATIERTYDSDNFEIEGNLTPEHFLETINKGIEEDVEFLIETFFEEKYGLKTEIIETEYNKI